MFYFITNPYNQLIMKKILLVISVMIFSAGIYAQGDLDNTFYFRFGISKPTKSYGGVDDDAFWNDLKRNGLTFELGQIFMINQLQMADGLRLGVNVDYLALNYHAMKDEGNGLAAVIVGSKIGPSLSYSPVDKLVFDGYIKLNPTWVSALFYVGESAASDYGLGFVGIGYSMGINVRYSILMLGFEFNKSWNKLKHYDADGNATDDYFGNFSDPDKDRTPMPSYNFTIGLAF